MVYFSAFKKNNASPRYTISPKDVIDHRCICLYIMLFTTSVAAIYHHTSLLQEHRLYYFCHAFCSMTYSFHKWKSVFLSPLHPFCFILHTPALCLNVSWIRNLSSPVNTSFWQNYLMDHSVSESEFIAIANITSCYSWNPGHLLRFKFSCFLRS